MKNRLPRQFLCVTLAAALAAGTITRPARGMLTELAVGSTLLLQTLAVVTELLPQITELTTNMLTLYRTGSELADTVGKIFDLARPKGEKAGRGKGKPAPPVAVPEFTVPVIGRTEEAEPEPPVEEPTSPADENGGSIGERVDRLASTHKKQQALLTAMKGGGDKVAMRAGFEKLQHSLDRLTESVSGELATAFEKNQTDTVTAFLEKARALEDRRSLAPVLSRFMETARFLVLYDGSLAERPEYAELKGLAQELRGEP